MKIAMIALTLDNKSSTIGNINMSFRRILFLCTVMVAVQTMANDYKCSQVLSDIVVDDFNSRDFIEQNRITNFFEISFFKALGDIEDLSEELISGKVNPDDEDFFILNRLKYKIEKSLKGIKNESDQIKSAFHLKTMKYISDNHHYQHFLKSEFKIPENISGYDFRARIAYRLQLQELSSYLPISLQFSPIMLPVDPLKNNVIKEAQEMISGLEKKHETFLLNLGYQSQAELIKELSKCVQFFKESYLSLKQEDFEFAINVPNQYRTWISRVGFLNQHETKSSEGYEGLEVRTAQEASYLGMVKESYSRVADDLKAKYGYLIPNLNSGIFVIESKHLNQYGSDIYLLKKDSLIDRVTFTLGDSLNSSRALGRHAMKNGKTYTPESFDQIFTPWSRFEILALFIDDFFRMPWLDSKGIFNREKNNSLFRRSHQQREYVELQFWGPIDLDNVKSFVFKIKPPEGIFLEELMKRHIIIYDGRYMDYNGGIYKFWDGIK
jgi:hypothetical protein